MKIECKVLGIFSAGEAKSKSVRACGYVEVVDADHQMSRRAWTVWNSPGGLSIDACEQDHDHDPQGIDLALLEASIAEALAHAGEGLSVKVSPRAGVFGRIKGYLGLEQEPTSARNRTDVRRKEKH